MGSVALFAVPVHAAAPENIFTYQGRLLTSNGIPVADESASMVFALYDAQDGGTCLWSNSSASCATSLARSVDLIDGLFSEDLGDTSSGYAALGDSVFGESSEVYLQVTINGETLTPRKRITSTPFATNAHLLDGLTFSDAGSLEQALVAFTSEGNLLVTGNPLGSSVSDAAFYINPAAENVSLGDVIFGVGVGGSSRFRVDAEGDATGSGSALFDGFESSLGTFLSWGATASLFDNSEGSSVIYLGGVVADIGNDIEIATEGTTNDSVRIGNDNALTTVEITSGSWSITDAGVGNFSDIACTDCLDFSEIADNTTLDANTTLSLGDLLFTVNASGSGDILFQDNGSTFLTLSDTGAYTYTLDSVDNPAYTITNSGGGNVVTNLAGSGDFIVQNEGVPFATFADDSSVTFMSAFTTQGDSTFGDLTGEDNFIFSSAQTTNTTFLLRSQELTTGYGMRIVRDSIGAGDFDGILFEVDQVETSAGSDGRAVNISNAGGGNSVGLYLTQLQVADATTTPTAQALVIDVGEFASNDEVILIRSDSDNSDGLRDTEFRFENDGDFFGDGATYNSGADYAEFFPTKDTALGDYDLVCWNPLQAQGVQRCAPGSDAIVGVVSTNPGFIGNNFVGAEGNLENNPSYALVGLVGQIETRVSAESGPIAIGDALQVSATRPGYAMKASGGSYIVGRALEPLVGNEGTVRVLVQPMWYGGNLLTDSGTLQAPQGVDIGTQGALAFLGGDGVSSISLHLEDDERSAGLVFANEQGESLLAIGTTGDLSLSGALLFKHGSSLASLGLSGNYLATSAYGYQAPSSGFGEMFFADTPVELGDIVAISSSGGIVPAREGDLAMGVVTDRVGFLSRGDSESGSYPVALQGKVRVKVSGERGSIVAGERVAPASLPGFIAKYTGEQQASIGYALESWDGGEGFLDIVLEKSQAGESQSTPRADISNATLASLSISDSLTMMGGDILSVGTIAGISDAWRIDSEGNFFTTGDLARVVKNLTGGSVTTYAATSPERTLQLSGTVMLHQGSAQVLFSDVESNFSNLLDEEYLYRAFLTPQGMTGSLYVVNRNRNGFTIRDTQASEGVLVDWFVVGYLHNEVPEYLRQRVDEEFFAPEESLPEDAIEEVPQQENLELEEAPSESSGEPSEPQDDVMLDDPTQEQGVPENDQHTSDTQDDVSVTDEVPVEEVPQEEVLPSTDTQNSQGDSAGEDTATIL